MPVDNHDPSLGTNLLRRHRDLCLADDSPDQTETRAWCFQESILSPRCLVYSSLNMYWGCHDVPYADRDQVARDYRNANGIVNRKVGNLTHVFRSDRQGDSLTLQDEEELYSFWNSVVEEYAGRQISFQNDKLRAIFALAQEYQKISGDSYMAGLWKKTLHKNLLWRSLSNASKNSPKRSGASSTPEPDLTSPTWSRLGSAFDVCTGDEKDLNICINIINVDCELQDVDEPFGSVKSGVLELRGRLIKVKYWHHIDEDGLEFRHVRKHIPHREDRENFEKKDAKKWDFGTTNRAERWGTEWLAASCDRDMNENGVSWREYEYKKEAKLWALEVGWKEGRTSPGDMEPGVTLGLFLVGTNVKDVFMRVGVFKVREMEDVPWFEEVEKAMIEIVWGAIS